MVGFDPSVTPLISGSFNQQALILGSPSVYGLIQCQYVRGLMCVYIGNDYCDTCFPGTSTAAITAVSPGSALCVCERTCVYAHATAFPHFS